MIDKAQIQPLINTEFINDIFQKATKSSFVLANATRLPNMTGATTEITILDELPTAYWTDYDIEHRKLTKLGLQGKQIVAKEAHVLVPISLTAIEDAKNGGNLRQLIIDRGGEAIGKIVDEAFILGKNKPRGFREGVVPSAIAVGATVTQTGSLYKAISDAMALVEESDYEPTGIVGGLSVKSAFRNMLDTSGRPITGTEIDSLPKTYLRNGAWDKKVATLVVGDWKQVYYAIRQELKVDVFDQATIKDPLHVDSNGNPIEYNLAQQRMIAIMLTIRLGWEIPNPISIETESNNPVNYFPFAIVAPTDATVPNNLTLTVKVTKDGTTAIEGADVFIGGNKRTTDATGTASIKVQPNTSYSISVYADGYSKYDYESYVESEDKTVTLTLTEYTRYYGISSANPDAKTVNVPKTLKQTSTEHDVSDEGNGTDAPVKQTE
ncbi:MAG: phage major capsid protein [Anaeroplasma bactoclasticum]|nr:phage major capsid protein [Anaeroplasma bactoclasticum]